MTCTRLHVPRVGAVWAKSFRAGNAVYGLQLAPVRRMRNASPCNQVTKVLSIYMACRKLLGLRVRRAESCRYFEKTPKNVQKQAL